MQIQTKYPKINFRQKISSSLSLSLFLPLFLSLSLHPRKIDFKFPLSSLKLKKKLPQTYPTLPKRSNSKFLQLQILSRGETRDVAATKHAVTRTSGAPKKISRAGFDSAKRKKWRGNTVKGRERGGKRMEICIGLECKADWKNNRERSRGKRVKRATALKVVA